MAKPELGQAKEPELEQAKGLELEQAKELDPNRTLGEVVVVVVHIDKQLVEKSREPEIMPSMPLEKDVSKS